MQRSWVLLVATLISCARSSSSQPSPAESGPVPPSAPMDSPAMAENAEGMYAPLPCLGYHRLPANEFRRNTLVEDACLEIPAGTTITLGQDVHLILIATRKLRIGAGVTVNAKGPAGPAGRKADQDVEVWRPSPPDQNEKIHCACRDTHCRDGWGHCSAANKPHLVGHRGEPGRQGGRLDIVARETIVGPNGKLDLSGGPGGGPGASGRVDCMWGGIQCSATSGHEGHGPQGNAGAGRYKTGTSTAAPVLRALKAATIPSDAAHTQIIDTRTSLHQAIAAAREAGRTFDNLSGVP